MLTVFAESNFVADFLRDTERKPAKNGYFAETAAKSQPIVGQSSPNFVRMGEPFVVYLPVFLFICHMFHCKDICAYMSS